MSESEKVVKKTLKYCPDTTYAYPLTIKSGNGCYIEDLDGKKYLDFNSQVCSCPVGYGHPEILEVIRKYSNIGAHKIGGQDFFTVEQADLAEKFSTLLPRSLSKIFFINTGAEAVENALKLCYRKRSLSMKVPANDLFGVSCYGAFHGRTLGALTFNYSKQVHKKGYPEFRVKRINFCTEDSDPNIGEIKEALSEPNEIAFVLMEPVQGEGGYRIGSRKFIKTIRDETEKHRVPLIMDEVQSGMGRTGKWWAFEHYGIEPDLLTTAKALQVGAVAYREEYDPKERGAISSTWGGGSRIDMAVGLKTIEIIEKEGLLKNAEKMGKYFLKRIDEMKEQYPQIIVGSSGLGLMVKADFNTKENRDYVEDNAFKDGGLMLLGCGEKTMRIAPPLIVTEKEADEGMDIFERQVKKLVAGH